MQQGSRHEQASFQRTVYLHQVRHTGRPAGREGHTQAREKHPVKHRRLALAGRLQRHTAGESPARFADVGSHPLRLCRPPGRRAAVQRKAPRSRLYPPRHAQPDTQGFIGEIPVKAGTAIGGIVWSAFPMVVMASLEKGVVNTTRTF